MYNLSNHSESCAHRDIGKSCPLFDSRARCDTVQYLHTTVASISLLACLYIVVVIILTKRYKFQPQRLILYLSTAEFVHTLFYAWEATFFLAFFSDIVLIYESASAFDFTGIVSLHSLAKYPDLEHDFNRNSPEGQLCEFQGWYHIFTAWIMMLLLCIITFSIVMTIVMTKRLGWRAEIIYGLVVLILPTIISVLPFSTNAYGPAKIYCWITVTDQNGDVVDSGVGFQFGVFYGPWIFLCTLMATVLSIVIGIVKYRLRKAGSTSGDTEGQGPLVEATKNLWNEQIKPLMPFPLIYIATFVLPMINRLRVSVQWKTSPCSDVHFTFWIFHAFFLPLPGILFAVAFMLDRSTRFEIKRMLLRCYRKMTRRWREPRDPGEESSFIEQSGRSAYGAVGERLNGAFHFSVVNK